MEKRIFLPIIFIFILSYSISSYAGPFTYNDTIDKSSWNVVDTWNSHTSAAYSGIGSIEIEPLTTAPTESGNLVGTSFDVVADIFQYYKCANLAPPTLATASVKLEVFDGTLWHPIASSIVPPNVMFNIPDLTPYIHGPEIPIRLSWLTPGTSNILLEKLNLSLLPPPPFIDNTSFINTVSTDFANMVFNGNIAGSTQKNGRFGILNGISTEPFDPLYPDGCTQKVSVTDMVLYETIFKVKVISSATANLENAVVFKGDTINYTSNLAFFGLPPTLAWTKSNANINFSSTSVANPDLTGISKGNVALDFTAKNGPLTIASDTSTVSVIDIGTMSNFLVEKGGANIEQTIPIEVPLASVVDYDYFSFNLSGPPGFASKINYSINRAGNIYKLDISGITECELDLELTINYINTLVTGSPITSTMIPIKVFSSSITSNTNTNVVLFEGSSFLYQVLLNPVSGLSELNINTYETDPTKINTITIDPISLTVTALVEGSSDIISTLDEPISYIGDVVFTCNVKVISVNNISDIDMYENSTKSITVPINFGSTINLNNLTLELINSDGTVSSNPSLTTTTKSTTEIVFDIETFEIGTLSIKKDFKLRYTYVNASGIVTTTETPFSIFIIESSVPQ